MSEGNPNRVPISEDLKLQTEESVREWKADIERVTSKLKELQAGLQKAREEGNEPRIAHFQDAIEQGEEILKIHQEGYDTACKRLLALEERPYRAN